ncbi:hypothetical protein AeMF1_008748 [Aphanomyces euteiches]|nr:hypothetical protein AeMF1_014734 [Aphanomyces euteiches]KAH9117711.1 hypothetical protein AeMF1_008748 [Aphanomyces euteiches]
MCARLRWTDTWNTFDQACTGLCDELTYWIHPIMLDRAHPLDCDFSKLGQSCAFDCDMLWSRTLCPLDQAWRATVVDGLTHCMHSTKLDGTCALNFAACTTRLCALHWFQDIVNIYQ